MDSKSFRNYSLILKSIFIFTIFVPLISLLLIPILSAREIVKFLAKWEKDLGDILYSASAILACMEDTNSRRPRCNILIKIQVAGVICLEQLREITLKNALAIKNSDGSLKFKEMQQYPVSFLGYPFYKWDRHFDIENHVKCYSNTIVNEKALLKYISKLNHKGWRKERSLWEIILLDDYQADDNGDSTVIIFRCHHSLADGYSLASLLFKQLGGDKTITTPPPTYNKYQINSWKRIFRFMCLPLIMTYEVVKEVSEKRDVNAFRPKDYQIMSGITNTGVGDITTLELIKGVMKEHSVSFHSVVCAAIAGGLRKHMTKKGLPIPAEAHAISPGPYPGHPDYFVNHFSIEASKLLVGSGDPIERLKIADETHTYHRRSNLPMTTFFFQRFAGLLIIPVCRFLGQNFSQATATVTSFPISTNFTSFQGLPITDIVFTVGSQVPTCGLAISICIYKGHFRVSVVADETIFPSAADAECLSRLIVEEFAMLRKCKKE